MFSPSFLLFDLATVLYLDYVSLRVDGLSSHSLIHSLNNLWWRDYV